MVAPTGMVTVAELELNVVASPEPSTSTSTMLKSLFWPFSVPACTSAQAAPVPLATQRKVPVAQVTAELPRETMSPLTVSLKTAAKGRVKDSAEPAETGAVTATSIPATSETTAPRLTMVRRQDLR